MLASTLIDALPGAFQIADNTDDENLDGSSLAIDRDGTALLSPVIMLLQRKRREELINSMIRLFEPKEALHRSMSLRYLCFLAGTISGLDYLAITGPADTKMKYIKEEMVGYIANMSRILSTSAQPVLREMKALGEDEIVDKPESLRTSACVLLVLLRLKHHLKFVRWSEGVNESNENVDTSDDPAPTTRILPRLQLPDVVHEEGSPSFEEISQLFRQAMKEDEIEEADVAHFRKGSKRRRSKPSTAATPISRRPRKKRRSWPGESPDTDDNDDVSSEPS